MRSFPILSFSLLFWAICPAAGGADEVSTLLFDPVDERRDRTVPVKVYLPDSDKPEPVILFSHGLGGSREGNAYLGEHWSAAGYVVVFVQHIGSDRSVFADKPRAEMFAALKAAANLKSTIDRVVDIPFVIDVLERWNEDSEHPLFGLLDLERIGMAGHSYGAVTTQAMMGERYRNGRAFGDERIGAFLPMSPSAPAIGESKDAFAGISSPVLTMTGTEDGSPIKPEMDPATRTEVFEFIPPGDKYQLVFDGGEHHAFSDFALPGAKRIEHHHDAILRLSTHFWDAYLREDEAAKQWLRSEQAREESGLKDQDIWEWK